MRLNVLTARTRVRLLRALLPVVARRLGWRVELPMMPSTVILAHLSDDDDNDQRRRHATH